MGGRVSVEGEWDGALTQSISEAPYWTDGGDDRQAGEDADKEASASEPEDVVDADAEAVVYATPPEEPGSETTTGVPVPDSSDEDDADDDAGVEASEPDDPQGQTTLDDWAAGDASTHRDVQGGSSR